MGRAHDWGMTKMVALEGTQNRKMVTLQRPKFAQKGLLAMKLHIEYENFGVIADQSAGGSHLRTSTSNLVGEGDFNPDFQLKRGKNSPQILNYWGDFESPNISSA